ERTLGEGSTSGYITNGTTWSDRRWTRSENSVSLGYNVWAGFSLFAGYLSNATKWRFENNGGTSYGDGKYTERGPYFGLAYSHRFAQGGSLTASYAYLKGHGNYSLNNPSQTINQYQAYSGDVTGSSYGLA